MFVGPLSSTRIHRTRIAKRLEEGFSADDVNDLGRWALIGQRHETAYITVQLLELFTWPPLARAELFIDHRQSATTPTNPDGDDDVVVTGHDDLTDVESARGSSLRPGRDVPLELPVTAPGCTITSGTCASSRMMSGAVGDTCSERRTTECCSWKGETSLANAENRPAEPSTGGPGPANNRLRLLVLSERPARYGS